MAQNRQVRAAKPIACVLQHPSHTADIVAPVLRGSAIVVERQFDGFTVVGRMHNQSAVVAGSNRNTAREINGSGHNKSVVVIRILTNKVYPPTGPVNPRGNPKNTANLPFHP